MPPSGTKELVKQKDSWGKQPLKHQSLLDVVSLVVILLDSERRIQMKVEVEVDDGK